MIRLRLVCTAMFGLFVLVSLVGEVTLSVAVDPGENWHSRMWVAIIPVNKPPQVAVWVETMEGAYVETLMVTGRSAARNWRGAPDEGRPESLPVWYHVSALAGEGLDAASSATPDAYVQYDRGVASLLPGTMYRIRAEVNHSFDYNEFWPKKAKKDSPRYSGVNGQPSVIYEGTLAAIPGERTVLSVAGQGSVDGSNGLIHRSLEGLTTALSIVDTISVSVHQE